MLHITKTTRKYILKELNLNDLQIEELIFYYEPSLYWLDHLETTLEQFNDVAIKVDGADIQSIITRWVLKKRYIHWKPT